MGGRCWVGNHSYRVANHSHIGNELESLDKFDGALQSTLQLHRYNARSTLAEVLLCQLVACIVLEAYIANLLDIFVRAEELCQLGCSLGLVTHTQRESLQAEHHQVCIEWRRATTKVTQTIDATLYDKGLIRECLPQVETVIALRWAINLGIATIAPVESSAIDNDTAHSCTVTINPLGSRVTDDVGTPLEWVAEVATSTKGVVHYEWHLVCVSNLCQSLDIGNNTTRIRHRLHEYEASLLVNQLLDSLGRSVLRKAHLDTKVTQRDRELIVCTAIDIRRGYDIVASLCQCCDGEQNRRHTRRGCQCAHSAIQRRHTILVVSGCRVVDSCIDIARLAQLEEVGCVVATFEVICSGRIDGQTTRKGVVRSISTVNLQCLETEFFLAHRFG